MLELTPDLVVQLLRYGLKCEAPGLGCVVFDPATRTYRHTDGHFDKDAQGWVVTRDDALDEAAVLARAAGWREDQVRVFVVNTFAALAFDAYLRGDAADARLYADHARAWQDRAGPVTRHSAELFQALAATLEGKPDEARALAANLTPHDFRHALAGVFGHERTAEHLRAIWTAVDAVRGATGLTTFDTFAAEARETMGGRGADEGNIPRRRVSFIADAR